jgi:hypothetical protein
LAAIINIDEQQRSGEHVRENLNAFLLFTNLLLRLPAFGDVLKDRKLPLGLAFAPHNRCEGQEHAANTLIASTDKTFAGEICFRFLSSKSDSVSENMIRSCRHFCRRSVSVADKI